METVAEKLACEYLSLSGWQEAEIGYEYLGWQEALVTEYLSPSLKEGL